MKLRTAVLVATTAAIALAGCASEGDVVVNEGVGITAIRSVCPAVGVPHYTGDLTLFSPAGATTADALDVTAVITNLRSNCTDQGADVYALATFEVQATRRDTRGDRQVTVPYYATVLRGGSSVVSKRVNTVTLYFAARSMRATGSSLYSLALSP